MVQEISARTAAGLYQARRPCDMFVHILRLWCCESSARFAGRAGRHLRSEALIQLATRHSAEGESHAPPKEHLAWSDERAHAVLQGARAVEGVCHGPAHLVPYSARGWPRDLPDSTGFSGKNSSH